jgi:hypothetical protein
VDLVDQDQIDASVRGDRAAAAVTSMRSFLERNRGGCLVACADSGIRLTDTRHEATAWHAADAWARVTQRPGVCRNLFNKLLGQLYYCLQHHQTFDEAKAFPMPLCEAAGRSDSTPSRARDVAAEHEQLMRRREAL